MVNFMASYAKGLICVALTKDTSQRLKLAPMVSDNDSSYETAFTISVDAKNCTTGISAYERDETIKILANPLSKPSDLVRPGHIFPLIAKEGGVLERTGHTEGSVDLCRLAGVSGCAVICEIMKADGTMARRDDLDEFAKKYNLNIVYISDIVEHRMQSESLISMIAESNVNLAGKKARRYDFLDHQGRHHIAFSFGKISSKTNVKFHHISRDVDLLSSSDRYFSLIKSIEFLEEYSGCLVFMEYDNKGIDQFKDYGIGAQILKSFGIKHINLIVTKEAKTKEFVGISGFGLTVDEHIVLN
jgi:3,4-dihydroxy 2-butanone 4-phosphate synthase/GTP cyclohydrolase II